MPPITLTVNGESKTVDVSPDTPLLWVLRDTLALTGTKFGCGLAQCGACTVHVDGIPVKSCMMLAVQADGTRITTVEGLAPDGELTPLQEAFSAAHALQCGYCTPGMLMSASALLERSPSPSEEEIKVALQGNICRCTGYWNIVEAVRNAAEGGAA